MTRRPLLILFFIGALSSSIALAGERLRVVVNELDANGVSRQVARVVSDHLRVKLIESRRFVVPERERMEAILQEQAVGIQLGECFSQECAIEIGRLMQANKMLVGTASLLNETYSISVRFLDLETGAAEFSAEEKCQSLDDLYLAAERLAARIVAFVPQRGHVTAVSADNIIIDLGGVDGIAAGMKLQILREIEQVEGYPEEELVTMVSVTSMQDGWSRVRLDQGHDPASFMRRKVVQVGDIVKALQVVTVDELPQYTYLMVYSQPVGAEVYIDNLFRGRTEKNGLEVRVLAERHTVRVTAPAHRADEREIELRPGQRMPYNATLEPRVPRTRYRLPIVSLCYVRQTPDDAVFDEQLDNGWLHGGQLTFGNISVPVVTELGASWTHSNMASGEGYGLDEVHRLTGFGHMGLAFRWGMFVPYVALGYEFGQLMFNENNVFEGTEGGLGSAGKIDHDGWYWTSGVFVSRWLRLGYRSTWGRSETNLTMFTIGLNLSGF